MTFIDQQDPPILINVKDDNIDIESENVPMRFRVGNIEFFGDDADPYLTLPAIEIALYMVASLRVAQRRGRCALDLGRFGYGYYLVFLYTGEDIFMGIPDPNGPLGTRARYTTIFRAWKEFADMVHDTAVRQRPEVAGEPGWSLLTDDPPEDVVEKVEEMTTRPFYFRRIHLCFSA